MQPMGFWGSIAFGFFCTVFYAICGYAAVTFPGIKTRNSVKLLGMGAAWPIILLIGLAMLLRMAIRRLARDTRQLLPSKRIPLEPKQVTIEMLANETGAEHAPGRWRIPDDA